MLVLRHLKHRDNVIVIGSGASLLTCKKKLKRFIKEKGLTSIGVNCMTHIVRPDYHLWTNRKQFKNLSGCIHHNSTVLIGSIPDKLVKKYWKRKFIRISYESGHGIKLRYQRGFLMGNFRTAGVLAIAIAFFMGAKRIYVAGMDGYTLHRASELKSGAQSQHCYGKGRTDGASWKECQRKDKQVSRGLKQLRSAGANFEIITPTVFTKYSGDRL